MIWQILATTCIAATALTIFAYMMDSPFSNVVTKWTYIASGSFLLTLVAAVGTFLTLVWSV